MTDKQIDRKVGSMINYHILSYLPGFLIAANHEPTGQYVYMGRDGKWESYEMANDYFADYGEALTKMEELMNEEKEQGCDTCLDGAMINKYPDKCEDCGRVGDKKPDPKYEARISKVTINKPGEPLLSEMATNIEIDDEGGGEFLKVSQSTGSVLITPDEWPVIRKQIDEMILNCREEK